MTFLAIFFFAYLSSAEIWIYGPEELQKAFRTKYGRNTIPSSLGNFGDPPYGETVMGRLHYFGTSESNSLGCEPLPLIDWSEDSPGGLHGHIQVQPILLIDRGECTFSTKVHNASRINASVVIFADNVQEDIEHILMIDDHTQGNLEIPCLLISYEDGQLLKQYLVEGQHKATLGLRFEIAEKSDYVHASVWMTPDAPTVQKFIPEFRDTFAQFETTEIQWQPRYVLWQCGTCSNDHYSTAQPSCVSGGRFCAPDPDGSGERTGRDSVLETLNQICVYNISVEDENPMLWFDYFITFTDLCSPPDQMTTECAHLAMEEAGIDVERVETCVRDSFVGEDFDVDDNLILQREVSEYIQEEIWWYPRMVINDRKVRGDLEVDEIMRAICSAFDTIEPAACEGFLSDRHNPFGPP